MSKTAKVELVISRGLKDDDVRNWIIQIPDRLPNVSVSNVSVNQTNVSFDISTRTEEQIDPKEVGPQIKNVIDSGEPINKMTDRKNQTTLITTPTHSTESDMWQFWIAEE